jgi:hypothetical protein
VFILGLDKIEFLQTHEKTEIYERAYSILQEYYGNDEEEDQMVAPSQQNNEFQFTNEPIGGDQSFQF